MIYPGVVVGVFVRQDFIKGGNVVKSRIQFKQDETTRIELEIDGEYKLGTKFTMTVEGQSPGEITEIK